jgi:glucan 1,3-beta-glucosidase
MSLRKEKFLALASIDYQGMSIEDLRTLFRKTLESGMHGLCSSPYEEGQEPGDQLSEEQIRRRLEIMKPYTGWIRTFSCTDGNELIPKIAKEDGNENISRRLAG